MMVNERLQFCIECRKLTGYKIIRRPCIHSIKGKEYSFNIAAAVCEECGKDVYLPGLMDNNAKSIDEQYRKIEKLVSIEDINTLLEVYNIGKAPLSLALGFGEITITRYIQGQYPSLEYSNIIREVLTDPTHMMSCLNKNKNKIGETAYKKAYKAALDLENLIDSVSEKMLITISYIFEKVKEVTPLALQKMLYYVQGIFMVSYGKPLFDEECLAWMHGPVYEKVYEMFKSFKYNPIEDKRFIIFKDRFQKLTEEEKRVIDNVVNSFGMYSGKTLEEITHKEAPWADVYNGDNICGYTNELITKDAMMKYFKNVAEKYDLNSEEELKRYILSQLESV